MYMNDYLIVEARVDEHLCVSDCVCVIVQVCLSDCVCVGDCAGVSVSDCVNVSIAPSL